MPRHTAGQKFLFFHLLCDLIRTRGRKPRNNADRYRVDDKSLLPPLGVSKGGRGPLLSLRVRVHRERGSRKTLSLCASLVTFSASRKSPHGVTRSRSLRKPDQNAPQSNRQCDTATTPPSKPHPGHAPLSVSSSPADHSSLLSSPPVSAAPPAATCTCTSTRRRRDPPSPCRDPPVPSC